MLFGSKNKGRSDFPKEINQDHLENKAIQKQLKAIPLAEREKATLEQIQSAQ